MVQSNQKKRIGKLSVHDKICFGLVFECLIYFGAQYKE